MWENRKYLIFSCLYAIFPWLFEQEFPHFHFSDPGNEVTTPVWPSATCLLHNDYQMIHFFIFAFHFYKMGIPGECILWGCKDKVTRHLKIFSTLSAWYLLKKWMTVLLLGNHCRGIALTMGGEGSSYVGNGDSGEGGMPMTRIVWVVEVMLNMVGMVLR